jgi:metal-responsive CopG/Arc/MetJ family transcriptional regulator
MSASHASVRKITISVPAELVDFADEQAQQAQTSRSAFITEMLAQLKAEAERRLAAEGYRYYAQEACAFADATERAVAEAWGDER